uniref:hypothetical protein n=1 Tax=Paractinoplanes polyasparticus TaxID=2856853 RepID=UPI001C85411C|nr:hypothetical protein [Actinoplanes polyasparticus]
MSRKRSTAWRRATAAYDVLRGRPPKPDYSLLIVLPMAASAGGALIGLGVDMAMTRRAARQPPNPVDHRT